MLYLDGEDLEVYPLDIDAEEVPLIGVDGLLSLFTGVAFNRQVLEFDGVLSTNTLSDEFVEKVTRSIGLIGTAGPPVVSDGAYRK